MLNKRMLFSAVALVTLMAILAGCGSPEPAPIPTPTAVPTLASVPTATLAAATATTEPSATPSPVPATATTVPTAEPTVAATVPATAEVTSTAVVTTVAVSAGTPAMTATVEITRAAAVTATAVVTSTPTVPATADVTRTAVITAASVLTGSTPLTSTVEVTAANQATGTTTAPIKSLVVAINAAFKPFVYEDENGSLAGFDIDLINAIGDVANVEIALVDTGFSKLLPGVAGGTFDAAISAISVTPDRSLIVSFTAPYFSTGQAPVSFFNPGQGLTVVAGTQAITGVASLTSATKIGVKAETTGAAYVPAETPAQAVAFPEAKDAFAALEKGEVDAVIIDIPIIAEYIKSNPGSVMLAGGPITEEEYAIAVDKDRPAVLALLNDALARLRTNGTYQTLIQKWFGTP